MIVHIFASENTFVYPFIQFLTDCFDDKDHLVLICTDVCRICFPKDKEDILTPINDVGKILKSADKIICHSLFNPKLTIYMSLYKSLLNKTYWVIWGGDLHFYESANTSIKYRVLEYFRRRFIKNIAGVCTLVDGDFDLLIKWYKTYAKKFEAIYAISASFMSDILIQSEKEKTDNKRRILVGNSATKSNLHKYVLNQIKDKNIIFDEIICPLSYGDSSYAKEIQDYGNELFGKKFVPIREYMSQEKYVDLLNSIDVAILYNDRQQALGNIYILTLLKKIIYLNPNSETYNQLVKKEGYHYYSLQVTEGLFFRDEIELELNQKKMILKNSIDNQYSIWNKIFKDDLRTRRQFNG